VADTPTGPWTELAGTTSPHEEELSESVRFYRAVDVSPESVFASRSVVAWTIAGPLQPHFDLAFAGLPDGIFPPRREKPYFAATLEMATFGLPVSLRVRGNSSLQECPFPKLKFKISREHRDGTPFQDAREIKIGTHCAEGGRGNIGRLRDETAAFREALAYETMELLGFVSPRVRRARIEYRDTATPGDPPTTGWQVTRQALILDDIEVVAERRNATALSDAEIAALTDARFDEELVAGLELLHALLGNWDKKLSLDGRGLWNTDVIRFPDGKLLPIAGDFDLSSWVTEVVRQSAPRDYRPDLPDVERQALYEVEQLRLRTSAPSFAAARQRFELRRTDLAAHLQNADVDAAGRTNALRHVAAFFSALELVQR
jgi:hypothetical protein